MARFDSRNTTRRNSATIIARRYFCVHAINLAGCIAGALGLAGVLVGRSVNRVQPAFFCERLHMNL